MMVVAPWVSDLLLAWGAGRRHGVWSMGVAVWVAGMCGCVTVGKIKMGMTGWVAGMCVG